MQEQDLKLSRDNLRNFLDFVAEKGLMKRQTAIGYKKASNIVLGILDKNESSDLSKIDLEDVITRHRNLAAGKISPSTLKTYEMRTRAAVSGFIEYTKNPSTWKPSIKLRTRKTSPSAPIKTDVSTPNNKASDIVGEKVIPSEPTIHIDFQIHISPEAKPEQIDQIFASMRRHLYGNKASE